jgi:hypothetical protein
VAELLGVVEANAAALMAVTPGEVFFNEDIGGWDETFVTTDRVDIVYWLLKRQSRNRIHKLLRDVGAVVEISRPRPKAERELHGPTPVEERVTLCIGALRMRWPIIPRYANETTLGLLFTPTT